MECLDGTLRSDGRILEAHAQEHRLRTQTPSLARIRISRLCNAFSTGSRILGSLFRFLVLTFPVLCRLMDSHAQVSRLWTQTPSLACSSAAGLLSTGRPGEIPDSSASHAVAREPTAAQRADLSLMQSLLPRPADYSQQEWDELLILEAPSVLGVASSSANYLDEESVSEGTLGSRSVSGTFRDSPCSQGTSLPYSMTDSDDVAEGGINVETSGLPSPLNITHPAELRSREALENGLVTRQAIMELLDLLPHSWVCNVASQLHYGSVC